MRDAVEFAGFAAGAVLEPDAYAYASHVLHRLGDDDEAVWQRGFVDDWLRCGFGHALLWHVWEKNVM